MSAEESNDNVRFEGKRPSMWPALLALLVILLVVGYAWARHSSKNATNPSSGQGTQRNNTAGNTSGNTTSQPPVIQAPVSNAALTSIAVIDSVNNPTSLVGKQVSLAEAVVKKVYNNKTFWVTDSSGKELLVHLPDNLNANNVNVTVGQHLVLTGFLQNLPSVGLMRSEWNLSSSDAQTISTAKIYLQPDSIAQR